MGRKRRGRGVDGPERLVGWHDCEQGPGQPCPLTPRETAHCSSDHTVPSRRLSSARSFLDLSGCIFPDAHELVAAVSTQTPRLSTEATGRPHGPEARGEERGEGLAPGAALGTRGLSP